MIKVLSRAFQTNIHPITLTQLSSSFGSQLQTINYPYVFGGLKNVPFTQVNTAYLTINQLFGSETLQGFKEAFQFTLTALQQKDLKSLQNICEPNLLKNLSFRNVDLINPNANIQVVCGRSFKAFGASFVRQATTQLKSMQSHEDSEFYLNLGLMNPTNPASMMKQVSSGLPILMGYEILFKTEMKLVPEGKRTQKVPEIHSIQFQVEGKMNIMKYMGLAMKIKGGQANVDFKEAKSIIKEMIGDNFDWKIGDIDRSLGGNLKILN